MSTTTQVVRDARSMLGITADATRAQVVSAFRHQARAVHPDVSHAVNAAARFAALVAAYRVALEAARVEDHGPAAASPTGPEWVNGSAQVRSSPSVRTRSTRRVPDAATHTEATVVWELGRPVLLVGPVIHQPGVSGSRSTRRGGRG